jgi:hypothetical protein
MKNTRLWSKWRVSRQSCGLALKQGEALEQAKRRAPRGYTHCATTNGEYVFRKPLPVHVREQRLHSPDTNTERAPY